MKAMEDEKNILKKRQREFQQAMAASKDFETLAVTWRYNEIWYSIYVAESVLSKEPGHLFGYRRLT